MEDQMSTEPWVEDENHRTINGEKWVARECEGGCVGNGIPDCEWRLGCFHCTRPGYVRWYRADSPALAFFDNQKEKPEPVTAPVRPLSEICMDGIRSSLKTFFHDRDRRAVEIMRDIRANSLDARVQAAMDAMMGVPDGFATAALAPTPAPEPASATVPDDNVEIIIDPTPEQVENEDVLWGCWWDLPEFLDLAHVGPVTRLKGAHIYKHRAYVVRGHLGPVELVARVRKMLSEKEGK